MAALVDITTRANARRLTSAAPAVLAASAALVAACGLAACGGSARATSAAGPAGDAPRPGTTAAAHDDASAIAGGPRRAVIDAVDRAIRARWRERGITPAPRASDATYLRRVTLDLTGTIPTPGEAREFLADRSPDKRERLVDRLLASPGYADHWADVYGDLLLGRATRARVRVSATPRTWLHDAFAAGTSLDDIAAEVLTAVGHVQADGATGFIAATRATGGDVADLAGATARLFLGVQIQCAQCHDHPYDARYTQADFAAFAAFFGDLVARTARHPGLGPTIEVMDDPAIARRRNRYAGVEPRFFGEPAALRPGETRRQALVRHILGSDLFAKVSVNRTWSRLFGAPLTAAEESERGAAWDDLGGEDDPSHSPLLRLLARDFEAAGYDHRRLLAIVALSCAYDRAATGGSADSGDTPRDPSTMEAGVAATAAGDAVVGQFARAALRPLTGDQLFRSVLVASRLEPALAAQLGTDAGDVIARRRRQALREILVTYPDPDAGDVGGNPAQALYLRNGALIEQAVRARSESLLGRALAASRDPGERLAWMFLAAYAREPTAAERARYAAYLSQRGDVRQAYEDLFHAMLTSTEFTTNH